MKRYGLISFIVILVVIAGFTSANGMTTGRSVRDSKLRTESVLLNPGEDEGKVIVLNKELFLKKVWNYEKNPDTWIYEGDKPCMIDFYADWCKPCRMVAPIMEELAQEYKGKIIIYKVNTQVERELANVFQVTSIPRVLFCPMKGKPQMSVGALPKPTFMQAINEVLLVK